MRLTTERNGAMLCAVRLSDYARVARMIRLVQRAEMRLGWARARIAEAPVLVSAGRAARREIWLAEEAYQEARADLEQAREWLRMARAVVRHVVVRVPSCRSLRMRTAVLIPARPAPCSGPVRVAKRLVDRVCRVLAVPSYTARIRAVVPPAIRRTPARSGRGPPLDAVRAGCARRRRGRARGHGARPSCSSIDGRPRIGIRNAVGNERNESYDCGKFHEMTPF